MSYLQEFPMQTSTNAKAKIYNVFIVNFFLFSVFEMSNNFFTWFHVFVSVSKYLLENL